MMQKIFAFLLASASAAEAQFRVTRVYRDGLCKDENTANSKLLWDKNMSDNGKAGGHDNAGCINEFTFNKTITGTTCANLMRRYYSTTDCTGDPIESPEWGEGPGNPKDGYPWSPLTCDDHKGFFKGTYESQQKGLAKGAFEGETAEDGKQVVWTQESCETEDPLKAKSGGAKSGGATSEGETGGSSSAVSTFAPFPAVGMAMALFLGVTA